MNHIEHHGRVEPEHQNMNTFNIVMAGRSLTPPEWLMLLGVAHYGPRKYKQPLGMTGAATTFDTILNTAGKRGFKERRQLIAAMRKGKASPTALARCEGVCALLTRVELIQHVAGVSRWLELMAGGRA